MFSSSSLQECKRIEILQHSIRTAQNSTLQYTQLHHTIARAWVIISNITTRGQNIMARD